MFCTRCGAEVSEGMKFCVECGAPIVKRQPADAFAQNPTQVLDQAAKAAQSTVAVPERAQQPSPSEMSLDALRDTRVWFEPTLSGGVKSKRSPGKGAIAGIVAGCAAAVAVVAVVSCFALGILPGGASSQVKSSESVDVSVVGNTSNVSLTGTASNDAPHATSDAPATTSGTAPSSASTATGTAPSSASTAVDMGSFDINNATHYATCNLFLDNFVETIGVSSLDAENPDMEAYALWAEEHIFLNRSDLMEHSESSSANWNLRIKLSDMADAVSQYTGVDFNYDNPSGKQCYTKDGYFYDYFIWGTPSYVGIITSVNYLGNDTYRFTFEAWVGVGVDRYDTLGSDVIDMTESEANARFGSIVETGTATMTIHDPADESTYTMVKYAVDEK